ncbi:hypothetical protein [Pontimicrobium sp. MEBiC01747]
MCWNYTGNKNKKGDIKVDGIILKKNLSVKEHNKFLKEKKLEAEKKGITIEEYLIELKNVIDRYSKKYVSADKYPRIQKGIIKDVFNEFGDHGLILLKNIEKEYISFIKSNKESGNWFRQRQLMSGMSHKKYPHIISFKTNFPFKELKVLLNDLGIKRFDIKSINEIKLIYKHFGEVMHPFIENRIKVHLEKLNSLNLDPIVLEKTGGIPGIHAEILAINDLLFKLEKKGIIIDDSIIKDILGYNKMFKPEFIQPRCADCYYLSADVKMIVLN